MEIARRRSQSEQHCCACNTLANLFLTASSSFRKHWSYFPIFLFFFFLLSALTSVIDNFFKGLYQRKLCSKCKFIWLLNEETTQEACYFVFLCKCWPTYVLSCETIQWLSRMRGKEMASNPMTSFLSFNKENRSIKTPHKCYHIVFFSWD